MAVHNPAGKGNSAVCPLRRLSSSALRMLGLALTISCVACASPGTRYRVLSLIFDGVPPYQAPELLAPVGTAEVDEVILEVEVPQHSLHPPFRQRRCELCHSRQASNVLIVEKHEICGICHTADMFEGLFHHGPVAASQCYACHDPHKSKFPNLLFASGSEVCAKCHTPETFAGIDVHRSEKGEECLDCHLPHVADRRYLLK